MNGIVFVVLVLMLLWDQETVASLRLLDLRAPAHVAEGEDALLSCHYDLEDDLLYSVKWYKDGKEFFRYVPKNLPPAIYFPRPGVIVDEFRSASEVVTLLNLTASSAGQYRCEVSGEAPQFTTVYDEKYIQVYLLPSEGPTISGVQESYQLEDRILVNCTSGASRPEALLKWLINNHPAPRHYLQGPWYRPVMYRTQATETILQMRFKVRQEHFREGSMRIKCQATIAPLYQKEESIQILEPEVVTESLPADFDIFQRNQVFPPTFDTSEFDDEEDDFDTYVGFNGTTSFTFYSKIQILTMIVILHLFKNKV